MLRTASALSVFSDSAAASNRSILETLTLSCSRNCRVIFVSNTVGFCSSSFRRVCRTELSATATFLPISSPASREKLTPLDSSSPATDERTDSCSSTTFINPCRTIFSTAESLATIAFSASSIMSASNSACSSSVAFTFGSFIDLLVRLSKVGLRSSFADSRSQGLPIRIPQFSCRILQSSFRFQLNLPMSSRSKSCLTRVNVLQSSCSKDINVLEHPPLESGDFSLPALRAIPFSCARIPM
mmetsp:Transcript_13892/g.55998  ORF Transcript_13892/g.55998 Transcript_13892/m.55998 type:complete len:242 (+) Transcript_13892:1173-1898(+)